GGFGGCSRPAPLRSRPRMGSLGSALNYIPAPIPAPDARAWSPGALAWRLTGALLRVESRPDFVARGGSGGSGARTPSVAPGSPNRFLRSAGRPLRRVPPARGGP